MAKTKIGIIGNGRVGSALARGFRCIGHDVRTVTADQRAIRDVAAWSEIILIAVPFTAIDEVVNDVGVALAGKTVIDVTNALDADMNLAVGFTTSGAEELQKKLPHARVVKAFNTVFAQHMDFGRLGDNPLTTFVAADDAGAKASVLALAESLGFDAVDAGSLKNARLLEPLAHLNIQLAEALGTHIGFRLLRDRPQRTATESRRTNRQEKRYEA